MPKILVDLETLAEITASIDATVAKLRLLTEYTTSTGRSLVPGDKKTPDGWVEALLGDVIRELSQTHDKAYDMAHDAFKHESPQGSGKAKPMDDETFAKLCRFASFKYESLLNGGGKLVADVRVVPPEEEAAQEQKKPNEVP